MTREDEKDPSGFFMGADEREKKERTRRFRQKDTWRKQQGVFIKRDSAVSPKGVSSIATTQNVLPFFANTFRGKLTTSVLREIYRQQSTVRYCVDRVCREITSLPWSAEVRSDASVTSFFQSVNTNGESLLDVFNDALVDLLVIDKFAIEVVRAAGSNKIVELYARDAATIYEVTDVSGVVLRYEQRLPYTDKVIPFNTNEMLFFSRFRTTYAREMPLIDSIVNEVAAMLFSIMHLAKSFSDDEIPGGILAIERISEEDYQRAKDDFTEGGDLGLQVLANAAGVNWLEFKRNNRDVQMDELRQSIDRIIYRTFCVIPTTAWGTQKTSGSDVTSYYINYREMIFPLVRLLQSKFRWVMQEMFPKTKFAFMFTVIDPARAEKLLDRAVIDRNDVRASLNLPEVEKGNILTVRLSGGEDIMSFDHALARGETSVSQGKRPSTEPRSLAIVDSPIDETSKKHTQNLSDRQLTFLRELQSIRNDLRRTLTRHALNAEATLSRGTNVNEVIDLAVTKMAKALKISLHAAADVGLDRVTKLLDCPPNTINSTVDGTHVEELLQRLLLHAGVDLLGEVRRALLLSPHSATPGEGMDRLLKKIDSIVGITRAAAHVPLVLASKKEPLHWICAAPEDCETCLTFQKGGPYAWNKLPALPGDGTTLCGGECTCFLARDEEMYENTPVKSSYLANWETPPEVPLVDQSSVFKILFGVNYVNSGGYTWSEVSPLWKTFQRFTQIHATSVKAVDISNSPQTELIYSYEHNEGKLTIFLSSINRLTPTHLHGRNLALAIGHALVYACGDKEVDYVLFGELTKDLSPNDLPSTINELMLGGADRRALFSEYCAWYLYEGRGLKTSFSKLSALYDWLRATIFEGKEFPAR